MTLVVGAFFTLLVSFAVTLAVRSYARRIGAVAAPSPDRWHQRPTALLGGVGIYSAFVLGYFVFAPKSPGATFVLAAATLLFVGGLVDDFVGIKPYQKLILQMIAAAAIVYCGLRLPWTSSQPLNDLITIFWLVGITNAINLLDNMDGLAGGVSVIACAFLTISFLLSGQTSQAVLPALLGASALGFLVFNFNPASIFMGDCGSMFLGFMLGGIALLNDYGRSRNVTAVLLTPVLILLIPIFDTCVVTVTRKLSGRKVSVGGLDHLSHRLVALGMSERRAVLMLYAFAAISGTVALLVRLVQVEQVLWLVPGFALVVVFVGLHLGKVRIYEAGEAPPSERLVRLLIDFSHKRRVFEVLLDAALIALAYYGAYLLRFETMPGEQLSIFARTLPLVIIVQILVFLVGGVYRGLWRYAGLDDLIVIGKSVLAGVLVSAGIVFAMYRLQGPSRAVFILDALLLFVLVSASRLSFRLMRTLLVDRNHKAHPDAKPVLIYGAGDGGELLVRMILNNPDHRYMPVAFIDDDAGKSGKILHGCRIFNSRELPDLIRRHGVSEVLVSSRKVSENRLEGLRDLGVSPRRMSIHID